MHAIGKLLEMVNLGLTSVLLCCELRNPHTSPEQGYGLLVGTEPSCLSLTWLAVEPHLKFRDWIAI